MSHTEAAIVTVGTGKGDYPGKGCCGMGMLRPGATQISF